jgi:hypothetical protein
LESGADVGALPELDQKLWAALSCPASGIEFDTRTLAHIDTDKDGRIRVPEILAAVKWIEVRLKNLDDLTACAAVLPLDAINEDTAEGRQMLASARQILANLGKAEAQIITPEDTADTARIFANTRFNGDGVLPPASADDAGVKQLIEDIMACIASATDRSGAEGVMIEHVDTFFIEARLYSDWWAQAEGSSVILPLGEDTHAAAAALRAVKAKVDDFFTRCRLADFDSQSGAALNPSLSDYAPLHTVTLNPGTESLVALPLARASAGAALSLESALNPAWKEAVLRFSSRTVAPVFGARSALSEAQWDELCAKFAPYESWSAAKQGAQVEALGLKRVREILAGDARGTVTTLIARDKALEAESNSIDQVDKLVLLHRDLFTLLNNFVALRDFYSRKAKAMFQAGTLYLDGRSCELCVAGRRYGKARRAGHSEQFVSALLRLHAAQLRGKNDHRRRRHRRRCRQFDGGPQRHILRSPGPRLGRHGG